MVASDRKMVTPRTSWKAVSKGPAVSAGSKPSRLDTMGIAVPANPERFTETNMEMDDDQGESGRVPQEPDQADHHGTHRADDHRRLDLPPERFPPPHELDLARGQTSHDHGHGLKPRVAGDRLDHRHEGSEQDDLAQGLVEEVDDHARHH